jgi:hypothetical protein
MKIRCISCEREINLNHEVFYDYRGSVKCFSCSAMMEIRTTNGNLEAVYLLSILPDNSTDATMERDI